jgi:hypothetical protein
LIATEENPELSDSFDNARRLCIQQPNDCKPKSSRPEHENKIKSRRTSCKPPESEKCNKTLPSHLTDLYQRSTKFRNAEEKVEIKELLLEFQDIFSKDENDVGRTTLIEHKIETADARPVKQLPRRIPLAFQNEEKDCIEKLLKQGIIRPSTSPWASPLVLVRKKDNSIRTCVDYRILNNSTLVDSFPMPRVSDCVSTPSQGPRYSRPWM